MWMLVELLLLDTGFLLVSDLANAVFQLSVFLHRVGYRASSMLADSLSSTSVTAGIDRGLEEVSLKQTLFHRPF